MRVIHVSHFHSTEVSGGVQRTVDALVADQRHRGWDVIATSGAMALDANCAVTRTADNTGTAVTRFARSEDERFSGDLGCDRLGDALEKLVSEYDADVCHVHHWHALTTDIVRRLVRHQPVVVTLHDAYATCARFFRSQQPPALCAADLSARDCADCLSPDLGLAADELEPLLVERHRAFAAELEAANHIFAVSEDLRQRVAAVPYMPRREIEVAPLGVFQNPGLPVPPAPLANTLRLGHWGGLDSRKGLEVLVDAMAGSTHAASFELHLFGTELEHGLVQRLTAKAGQARVLHHGTLADLGAGTSGLRRVGTLCDLAVLPSLLPETHGLAVDEALLMGMAVIVSDVGAPRHRVGTRGLVVPVDRPQPLRAALDELLLHRDRLDALRRGTHSATTFAAHAQRIANLYISIDQSPDHFGWPAATP